MALTDKQIHDLNRMNRAAQNVELGTMLNELQENSGGGARASTPTLEQFNALVARVEELEKA